MPGFKDSFSAEITKMKHTAAPWIAFCGAGFIPILLLFQFLMAPEKLQVQTGQNPWTVLLRTCFQFGNVLVIPLIVIILASTIMNLEHKSNTWKHMLVLPVSKTRIFSAKLLVVVLSVAVFYVFFILFLLLDALVIRMGLMQYGDRRFPFDWLYLAKLTGTSFISILVILAIHVWLAVRIKNIIVVVSIGLVSLIVAIIISSPGTFNGAGFFPYSFPSILSYRLNSLVNYPKKPYEAMALISFAIFIAGCFFDFKKYFRG